ncbi:uncharacterized protein KY384_008798 [Bacidia gigantensis]|uniref:uncharacterized protein n=1 Tax=Bacidia gigantensis TaxID=2732470 RepID=UPI001D046F16|nr:uncharacterized protein KY384_008798 [Bacidia gigantensis]KAG8526597.1 hypothetical protein KY384_008798 [Bacidia gigantensis]
MVSKRDTTALNVEKVKKDINDTPHKTTISPPIGQFAISAVLQLAAFAVAISFGIFAVKSVRISNEANRYASEALEETRLANRIALLAICASATPGCGQDSNLSDFCRRALGDDYVVFSQADTSAQGINTPGLTYRVPQQDGPTSTTSSSSAPSSSPGTFSTTTRTFAITTTRQQDNATPTLPSSTHLPGTPISVAGTGISKGGIAGIIIGVVAGVIAAFTLLFCLVRHRRRRRRSAGTNSPPILDEPPSTFSPDISHAPTTAQASGEHSDTGPTKRARGRNRESTVAPSRLWKTYKALFVDSTISTSR